ncbi:uncharacterized protein F5891DRAFT_986524 [Suillus fuscotomentosus]|uniref:Uncharacterized protein n=1 Tax=Suillus fuscotomentosus TaxID=1912939 RepID=A0AAD4HDM6_9AGAM|nr:uncharacterized protein F5891DRAFT_986524 [Suillus fuscotomentosus]KAG1891823.1 hypothetical protein F5891DRAFT_986524 [Suillus fuscotomentosus]
MPSEWTSICNTCSQKFKSYGLAAHQKACKGDALRMQEDHERQNAQAGSNAAPAMHEPTYDPYVNPDEGLPFTVLQEAPDDHVLPPAFQQDDIRTEHHMWDVASPCHANFKKKVISVPHRDQEHNFNVWYCYSHYKRSPEDAGLDPYLQKDLRPLLPVNRYHRSPPQTYRLLWDWACDLLKDPCLCPHFMFDAQWLNKYDGQDFVHFFDEPWMANAFWDSQKAYPVIARCANSPVRICNGEGFGGGRLIGWLPIVEEERQYSGTQSFVNFKNVVWHESFKCLLKSLTLLSKTGFCIKCWDGIKCLFYLLILILSADYEEQYMHYDLDMWNEVQIPLSYVAHTDIHSAVSFDRLHFQEHIKSIGRQTQSKIDEYFNSMPRWHNINHFNHVMDISFSDGSKYEDISKLIVFAAHDIINQATHALPYLLLQCIHEYVNIDIAKDDSGKNWAYPKRHAHAHLFDDIEARGAIQIYLQQMNFKNIAEQLGVAQKEQTFVALEQLHTNDNVFNWFCIKLANFLSDSLPAHGIPLSGGK